MKKKKNVRKLENVKVQINQKKKKEKDIPKYSVTAGLFEPIHKKKCPLQKKEGKKAKVTKNLTLITIAIKVVARVKYEGYRRE